MPPKLSKKSESELAQTYASVKMRELRRRRRLEDEEKFLQSQRVYAKDYNTRWTEIRANKPDYSDDPTLEELRQTNEPPLSPTPSEQSVNRSTIDSPNKNDDKDIDKDDDKNIDEDIDKDDDKDIDKPLSKTAKKNKKRRQKNKEVKQLLNLVETDDGK